MADDQRHDRGEIRQDNEELVRQAGIKRLQADLRRFREAKAERCQKRNQRTLASEHRAGHCKKSAAGHHAFDKGVDLHDGEIRAAKAGGNAAEKNASGLARLDRNGERMRDLDALAAGANPAPARSD